MIVVLARLLQWRERERERERERGRGGGRGKEMKNKKIKKEHLNEVLKKMEPLMLGVL